MKLLIIDDEPPAREELRRCLARFPDLDIVGECGNAIEGIAAIHRMAPDVVFLDIRMPRISGMEMLAMLDPGRKPDVVFLSAHDEYALQAFDQSAIDYLLKPVDGERLEKTIERLRRGLGRQSAVADATRQLAQIPCWGQNRVYLAKVSEIEFVISRASGVFVVDGTAQERFTELTLKTLEGRTPLFRCHRQALVNTDAIREIVFHDNGLAEIISFTGQKIPVSRRFLGALKARLAIS